MPESVWADPADRLKSMADRLCLKARGYMPDLTAMKHLSREIESLAGDLAESISEEQRIEEGKDGTL